LKLVEEFVEFELFGFTEATSNEGRTPGA